MAAHCEVQVYKDKVGCSNLRGVWASLASLANQRSV